MKTFAKVLAAVMLATMCAGYAYAELTAPAVETKWFVEVVHPGDTFNGIVEQYYDETIRANKSWDEWQTQQKEYNQGLFADGRSLQPGDKILIVTKMRVVR